MFQIFLSGFRGATLDKLRKIINIGGATRCNQINDNVTHVVIGDRINSDIDHIKVLGTRPNTVTINWLVECYKQEEHVEETNYYSSELPAPESSSSPQLKKYAIWSFTSFQSPKHKAKSYQSLLVSQFKQRRNLREKLVAVQFSHS